MTSLNVCILFLLSTWKEALACSQDVPCRELAFPNFFFFADKRLVNHTIKTVQVRDLDDCELMCYHEHNCVSLNFQNKASGKRKYSCELNNSTHGEHGEDLVEAKYYFYRGTENACNKSPCKNGGTCQSGFTKKRYRCLCPTGFMGRNCNYDIDECEENAHNCHKNATCKNKKGSYTCTCKPGYSGDGHNCIDIDECSSPEAHKCDANATCKNTKGSYNCTCDQGYVGDGHYCTDIDECSSPEANTCDANATCKNTKGSYNCTCDQGYVGDGHNCTECQAALGMQNGAISDGQISASSQYDSNHASTQGRLNFKATSSKVGSWSAQQNNVNQWLQVDLGNQPTEITRVATQGRNGHSDGQWVTKYSLQYSNDGLNFQYYKQQGQNANKEFSGNADGDIIVYHELNPPIRARYIRFRPTAWHGHISMRVELYGCKDIDECEENAHNCHKNASCKNNKGSYTCTCKPGYSGDGRYNCTDIDECSSPEANICDANATCKNTKGSYICTCDQGYVGDGHNCTDIDECEENAHNCHKNASCKNNKGSYTCTCKPGYSGDGYNCTDIDECSSPEAHKCNVNSRCKNTEGSYICECKQGYSCKAMMDSVIISNNGNYLYHLDRLLAPAVGNNSQWKLCYRVSIHGKKDSTFHSRCDGKNNTVTIIKKNDYVFGGFTDIPWEGTKNGEYSETSKSFIFSLRNKENIGPFKSMVTQPTEAIYNKRNLGATFGERDIRININKHDCSSTHLGKSYFVPSAVNDRKKVLAGSHKFQPDELEVFYLE